MPWDTEKYKNYKIRNTEVKPLKQVINDMFSKYRLSGKLREKQIINSWDQIMGISIAKRTSKRFIKEGILFVEITSAPLKNDLMLSKEKIIYLFEQEFGKGILKDLRFL